MQADSFAGSALKPPGVRAHCILRGTNSAGPLRPAGPSLAWLSGLRLALGCGLLFAVPVARSQPGPVRSDLSPGARRVMAFLASQRGVKTLAGQEETGGDLRAEEDKLLALTGRRPAIRGWDVRAESLAPFDEARRSWLNERQLVEFSWHLGLPPGPDTFDQAQQPSDPAVTTAQVAAIIAEVLAPGTARNRDFLAKLDRVATQLAAFQAEDIPVLWRPFHEAEADFGRVGRSPFWWGKGGAGPFKDLWRYEFDYFTRVRGLNNLIWIYSTLNNPVNGWPGDSTDWYPGDEFVDIVGSDIYRDGVKSDHNTAWATWHDALRDLGHGRPVVLAENDLIPDPAEMKARGTLFSWFLSWHTTYVAANSPASLRAIYQHRDVITADEMPNLRGPSYPAETAALSGGRLASEAAGFTGRGYAALAAGGSAEFTVAATMAGPHVLSFYCANGDPAPRQGAVSVDGRPLTKVRIAPTGDVSAWQPTETVALLAAGRNTVRITVDGPVQLDSLSVALSPVAVSTEAGGRLENLSTRARIGPPGLAGGFVLTGTGRREVLVRAAGPALAAFGVSGTLIQPRLALLDGAGRPLATNTGWSTSAAGAALVAAATARAGAFAFAPGSADSAVVVSLAGGSYTAQLSGADGGGGETLVEIYAGGADGLALANLSTLADVGGSGAGPTAGFVIAGGAQTVLIRGVGPALARFGVGAAVPDPTLTVFSAAGGRMLANDNWGSGLAPEAVAAAAVRCGAFPLGAGGRDAALIATLAPGAYTVQLGAASAAGGVGLIEIYLVP
ncbi:MAG: glycosyl hydrolase [Verrucomicrobia bacterium]|nr:glycosyl hydrolase [Verrucomicrobiota bacterium]